MDDVIFVGMPACEEHLKSKYLVFESNFDGDLDAYLRGLADSIAEHLDAIWQHCVGYPGAANRQAFIDYMKACQTRHHVLLCRRERQDRGGDVARAADADGRLPILLQTPGRDPATLQRDFIAVCGAAETQPAPRPGSMGR